MAPAATARFLAQEARALLTRLDRGRAFSLTMPSVAAAALPQRALVAIERHLLRERQRVRRRVQSFIEWLNEPSGRRASPQDQQSRFTVIRLQFNATLDQFDIFADVLTQRGEHETGVWLAGLDAVAADALRLGSDFFEAPPVVTYLDRGHGAAIRRARTRLPGGAENPVAIIRVPRERMVGSGIGSSLVHEVGHQGAALLDLVASLRQALKARQARAGRDKPAWILFERWISEIIADFWSLAKIGVGATHGLIGVVSLPRPFVFRINLDDPHPFPWIRVKLSCAVGRALYPDAQWNRLAALWQAMYPTATLKPAQRALIQLLEKTMPAFVRLLIEHRPKSLRGRALGEVLTRPSRTPAQLRELMGEWRTEPMKMCDVAPTLALAVLGQARVDRAISPEREAATVARLLTHWALSRRLNRAAARGTCARSLGVPRAA